MPCQITSNENLMKVNLNRLINGSHCRVKRYWLKILMKYLDSCAHIINDRKLLNFILLFFEMNRPLLVIYLISVKLKYIHL